MSTIFKNGPVRLLDYVMYHEMLHKKFKFDSKKSTTRYHTTEFRRKEAQYPGFSTIDAELGQFIRSFKQQVKKPKKYWWEL